jgi:SET domain-containing protein
MSRSYRSPKTRVGASPIHGRGLFAVRAIRKGEIVAIKGGHVLDREALRGTPTHAQSYIQIGDRFFVGAATVREIRRNKLYLNHSCEPNLGIRGEVTFVALRNIGPGEELTYDWAMEENEPSRTRCSCGARSCRGVLTGRDWRNPALQRRYRGYFSAYLAAKIARADLTASGRPRRLRGR